MAPGSERIAVGIALYGVLWESTSPRTCWDRSAEADRSSTWAVSFRGLVLA